jgi:hypothetical protein
MVANIAGQEEAEKPEKKSRHHSYYYLSLNTFFMKRNILALFAIVMAVVFSSFTIKTETDMFLVYDQVQLGDEDLRSSYDDPAVFVAPGTVSGTGRINWVKVVDDNDDEDITQEEFDVAFTQYNQVSPTSMLLSDESDITDELDVRSIPE